MYFPQMNFGYTHKNKIVFEKRKKRKNAPIFAKIHLKKSLAPLKLKIYFEKKIIVYDSSQKRLGTTESTQKNNRI